MSSSVSRLVLALSFLCSVPLVYTVLYLVIEENWLSNDEEALIATTAICIAYFIGAWILVWLGTVSWTSQRVGLTIFSVLAAGVPAAIVGLMIAHTWDWGGEEVGTIIGGSVWAVIWLAATAFVWRETAGERAQRLQRMGIRAVACPRCGYNLTGLKQSICPECGTQYTLDQLYAALSDRDGDVS